MDVGSGIGLIAVVALLIMAALLCVIVALWIFIGARALLAIAAEQGFIGLAVYVACWVFMFPVMLVICGFMGLAARSAEKEAMHSGGEQPTNRQARRLQRH